MFKNIEKLENNYRAAASHFERDFNSIMRLGENLKRHFREIVLYAKGLGRKIPSHDRQIISLLNRYLRDMEQIHKQNMDCLALYCSACWPAERENPQQKKGLALKGVMTQQAQKIWDLMERDPSYFPVGCQRIKEILSLKYDFEHLSINTVPWRLAYKELSKKLYDLMTAVLIENCQKLKKRFHIIAALDSLEGDDPGHLHAQGISDYIRGYTFWAGESHLRMVRESLRRLSLRVRKFNWFLAGKKTLQSTGVVVLLILAGWRLSVTDWDNRLFRVAMLNLKKIFRQDHTSLVLREQKQYLDQQINNIPKNYSAAKIKENIDTFIDEKIYEQQEGYFYFSENIFKGFMLLMSDWSTDPQLKQSVFQAADLLDKEAGDSLRKIVSLFEGAVIREFELLRHMLDLKRVLVDNGTFPFMFIALKDDVPYIFIFNEKILMRYRLTMQDIERTGLDKSVYNFLHKQPIVAYLVDGGQYPFKDRAGYFEGQYAVAFKSLSDNPEWTLYHEVAHLIDYARLRVEGISLADNREVNAMLLPLVWASDKKAYLREHMVPRALKRDPLDFYVQAVKGILNGYHIYLTENDPGLRQELITNKFEPDRINKIARQIQALSDYEINDIGYILYNDPQKYLGTALAGQYLIKLSNMQEIIYGAPHGVSKRGFILGGTGFAFGRNGPRFIIESFGTGDTWQGSFSLMSFLNNVLGVIFGRKNSLLQATKTEALTAAVFVFITFNGFVFLLHGLGSRLRRRMFYGWAIEDLIRHIYNRNGWSRGLSFGQESRERQLLLKIFQAQGLFTNAVNTELFAFKSTADEHQRLLFDICLCLAPFNPARTNIINKFHDLLFFLPFLGPYWGRAGWIWRVQKAFHQKESFNREIAALASAVDANTTAEGLIKDFQQIFERYGVASRHMIGNKQKFQNEFQSLEQYVFEYLPEEQQRYHMKMDFIMDQLALFDERSQEFDRLDEYYPGDDIRHIDWKATARSTSASPMIRKYSRPYGIKVAFWSDLRSIHSAEQVQRWARDFVRAVNVFNMLGAENVLEKIFYVLDNGEVHQQTVNLRTSKDNYLTAFKVLTRMKAYQGEISSQQMPFQIEGLKFYTGPENREYLKNVDLTDFGQGRQELRFKKVDTRRLNVLVIGSDIKDKGMIEKIIGPSSKVFYL